MWIAKRTHTRNGWQLNSSGFSFQVGHYEVKKANFRFFFSMQYCFKDNCVGKSQEESRKKTNLRSTDKRKKWRLIRTKIRDKQGRISHVSMNFATNILLWFKNMTHRCLDELFPNSSIDGYIPLNRNTFAMYEFCLLSQALMNYLSYRELWTIKYIYWKTFSKKVL